MKVVLLTVVEEDNLQHSRAKGETRSVGDGPYRVEIRMVRSHLFRLGEVQSRYTGWCKKLLARTPSILKVFFSRHYGGRSVMIWAAISVNGKTSLILSLIHI